MGVGFSDQHQGAFQRSLVQTGVLLAAFRQRAKEMWDCIHQLESEKFDLTEKMRRQKYEVSRVAENFRKTG